MYTLGMDIDHCMQQMPIHYLLLCPGCLASLALISFTLIFLPRNLPDTVNEAKFPTIDMLVTFFLIDHSTKREIYGGSGDFLHLSLKCGAIGCILAT